MERGPKYFRLDNGGKDMVVSVDHLKPHNGTAGATATRPPTKAAADLSSHVSDDNSTDYPGLTNHASDDNGTDNSGPGTISRTSRHYRSSPCVPAQSSKQIRPLSETKRSGGSDVATAK